MASRIIKIDMHVEQPYFYTITSNLIVKNKWVEGTFSHGFITGVYAEGEYIDLFISNPTESPDTIRYISDKRTGNEYRGHLIYFPKDGEQSLGRFNLMTTILENGREIARIRDTLNKITGGLDSQRRDLYEDLIKEKERIIRIMDYYHMYPNLSSEKKCSQEAVIGEHCPEGPVKTLLYNAIKHVRNDEE